MISRNLLAALVGLSLVAAPAAYAQTAVQSGTDAKVATPAASSDVKADAKVGTTPLAGTTKIGTTANASKTSATKTSASKTSAKMGTTKSSKHAQRMSKKMTKRHVSHRATAHKHVALHGAKHLKLARHGGKRVHLSHATRIGKPGTKRV